MRACRVPQRRSTHTQTGWEVYSDGLADILLWVTERYGKIPLYVTENGAAFYDPPRPAGAVKDPLRVSYLKDHLRAAFRAREQGVDLRGYFRDAAPHGQVERALLRRGHSNAWRRSGQRGG